MSFKDKILNNQSLGALPGGGGPSGNGSGTREPPNLDDIIKNFQKILISFQEVNQEDLDQ